MSTQRGLHEEQCNLVPAAERWLGTPTCGVPRLLLTPDEAAACLGISRASLYRLMQAGELRSVRLLERAARIPVAELELFVARLLEAPS